MYSLFACFKTLLQFKYVNNNYNYHALKASPSS